MLSDVPIKRMQVEAFRGFRDAHEFDLDASAVIVSGPNGTGKTSFFDAIQWCLIGSLERVAVLRAKRTVEHIVNQYRMGERASVELELVLHSQRINVRRVGDHSGSTLELELSDGSRVFGDEAEANLKTLLLKDGGPGLELALTTTGLMQQDVMRAMLQAKPADRYRHVSTVLGLGALEEFEDATKQAAKEAAASADAAFEDQSRIAASLQDAQERLDRLAEQATRRPSVESITNQIESQLANLPPGLSAPRLPATISAADLSSLAAAAGDALVTISAVANDSLRLANVSRELPAEPSEAELSEALSAIEHAARVRDAAMQAAREAQSILDAVEATASEVSRLAAAAIPQLSSVCPVCGQAILRDEVEAALRLRAGESSAVMAAAAGVQKANLDEREAVAAHVAAAQAHVRLVEIRDRWNRQRSDQQDFESAVSALQTPVGGFHVTVDRSVGLDGQFSAFAQSLTELRGRLLDAMDLLDDSAMTADLARARSEVESFSSALRARRQRVDDLQSRSARIKALSDATVLARVEVTEERFHAVQPLVADIFSRLDPHPAFKSIEFELDTYYKRGTTSPMVKDVVEGVSADPLVIFSTSQANIAALSYFLAMGWTAGDRTLPFVLLDDPVQSMDDVNVLGFADLSRHIRLTRQLVISTHERRFAGLLERKLTPRSDHDSTIVLEFLGWDRSGPSVTARRVEPQLLDRPILVVGAA